MSYSVEVTPRAERDIKRLPRQMQKRIATAIDALAENPRPDGVKKLAGTDNRYRVREGDYRIIFDIYDKTLLVILVRVAHRSRAY